MGKKQLKHEDQLSHCGGQFQRKRTQSSVISIVLSVFCFLSFILSFPFPPPFLHLLPLPLRVSLSSSSTSFPLTGTGQKPQERPLALLRSLGHALTIIARCNTHTDTDTQTHTQTHTDTIKAVPMAFHRRSFIINPNYPLRYSTNACLTPVSPSHQAHYHHLITIIGLHPSIGFINRAEGGANWRRRGRDAMEPGHVLNAI